MEGILDGAMGGRRNEGEFIFFIRKEVCEWKQTAKKNDLKSELKDK